MSKLISVCMIALNEEEVLQRCLDSIAGLWDELLVVVDNRTTDRTAEIVLDAGGTVLNYDFVAPGNKSEARNLGIDAASGQWIVVIDADEVVCEPQSMRQQIADAQANAIVVQFNNYINGEISVSWRQVRVFRRGEYCYYYREHEIPMAQIPDPVVLVTDILFEHRAPDNRVVTKSAPMMARLTLDVEENPNDPHPLYFLHRECVNQGESTRAIELGQQYLDLTRNGDFIQADIYGNMANAYQQLGNYIDACKHMHLATACEPNKREWYYRLGILYANQSQWNVALAILRAAAEILPEQTRQWEPMTTTRIYQLIERCQHELAHSMAHSH